MISQLRGCRSHYRSKLFSISDEVIAIGIKPELLPAFLVCVGAAFELSLRDPTNPIFCLWTSAYDRAHSWRSYHYKGLGADFQFWDQRGNLVIPQAYELIRHRLGADFDHVAKADHLHIEWDAKRPGQEARRVPLPRPVVT